MVNNDYDIENIFNKNLIPGSNFSNQDQQSKEYIELIEKAEVFMSSDRYEKALTKFLQARKFYENNYEVNFKIGDLYQRLEFRKGSKCIEYYREAFKYCKNIDQHYKLGEALILIDSKSEEAEDLFAGSIAKYIKEINSNPHNNKLFKFLGISYFYFEEPEKSLVKLKESIKNDSEDHESYFYLGEVYEKLENTVEAIKCYEKSIELKYKNIFPMYNLGKLYFKLGKNEDAIKYLDKALTIDNKYEDASNLKKIIKNSTDDNQIMVNSNNQDLEKNKKMEEKIKKQTENIKKAFKEINKNPNDRINKDELIEFMLKRNENIGPENLNKLFKTMDFDQNYSISM